MEIIKSWLWGAFCTALPLILIVLAALFAIHTSQLEDNKKKKRSAKRMETKNDRSLSYFINSFRLLSLDEFRDAFKELDSFEFNTISSDEYLLHVQQLYDDIEQQTKGDYKFYVNIEDKRMLDVETTVRHVRFDYVSNHCDTIIILFAAYLDSNIGALKDLMQYFDYRVYPKKRGT